MHRDWFERQWGWWLRKPARLRIGVAFSWLIPIGMIGTGAWGIYETMVKRPHDYSVLEPRGVRATASFAGCTDHAFGRGSDRKCRIRLPDSSALWEYGQAHGQFEGLPIGAPVEILVDPEDPTRRYTVADVQRRTNQGLGLLFGFSVLIGLVGIAAVPFVLSYRRNMLAIARQRAASSRDTS